MADDIQYTIRTKPNAANPLLIYVGEAYPASSEASALWRIKRIDETGGTNNAIVLYADGNTYFDNIWANREALSYS